MKIKNLKIKSLLIVGRCSRGLRGSLVLVNREVYLPDRTNPLSPAPTGCRPLGHFLLLIGCSSLF